MKRSQEALELAERIDCGEAHFFHDEMYDEIYDRFCDHNFCEWFCDYGNLKEHRVMVLCLYAVILEEEGK